MNARAAHESDAPAIVRLWQRFMSEEHEAVPDADPEGALARWSERLGSQIVRGQVLILETGAGVAGFAAFSDSADRQCIPAGVAYVVDLYVRPEERRAAADI
jgi:hypothetical protein